MSGLINCVDAFGKVIKVKLRAGEVITNLNKYNYISAVLASNPMLAAKLVAEYEPLLGVKYDEEQNKVIIEPTNNSKLLRAFNLEIDTINDIQFENDATIGESTISKGFSTEEDKAKIPNSALVESFVSSIPYINEIVPFNNINNSSYSYDGFLNYSNTLSVLKELYRQKTNIKSIQDLKFFLETTLKYNNANLDDTKKRIALSLYLHLFNESPNGLKFIDLYKKESTKKSLYSQYITSKDPSISTSIQNNIVNLIRNLISVNDESSIVVSQDDKLVQDYADSSMKLRIEMQRNVASNIYEELKNTDADGNETSKVVVNTSTIEAVKNKEIKIFYKNGYWLRFKHNGNSISIPFNLSTSKLEVPINASDFINKIILENNKEKELTLEEAQAQRKELVKFFSDKELIKDLFSLYGIDTFPNNFISDLLKGNTEQERENKLQQIYNILTSSIVALGLNIEETNKGQVEIFTPITGDIYIKLARTDVGKLSEEEVDYLISENEAGKGNYDIAYTAISRTIAKAVEKSKNIRQILSSSVLRDSGMDRNKVKTIFNNPLMLWQNFKALAVQFASSSNLFRNQVMYNAEGNRSEKGTVVSNIENFHRKLLEVRKNNTIRYSDNIFIKGIATVAAIHRYSGHKNDDTSKAQMSFNRKEINYIIQDLFNRALIDNYDYEIGQFGEAKMSEIFSEVYSDKSFFAGTQIETNYNQFPLIGFEDGTKEIDISYLAKRFYEVEASNKDNFTNAFVSRWNEWIRKEEEYLKLKGIKPKYFDSDNVKGLLDYIKTIPIPNKPISLTVNKYYIGESGSMFSVKPIIQDYLLSESNFNENGDITPKAKAKYIAYLAYNHNDSVDAGFDMSEQSSEFLKDLNISHNDSQLTSIINLSKYFEGEVNSVGEFIVARDSNGEMIIKKELYEGQKSQILLNEAFGEVKQLINPLEIAQFGNHLILADQLSQLVLGDAFQYKGNTFEAMLQDKLKRSVGAASPGSKQTLDTELNIAGNLCMPEKSLFLKIKDEKLIREILGIGIDDPKETLDGGSLSLPLAERMYQAGYAGNIGLFPNSSLKFIYGNPDTLYGDNQLIKYAAYSLTEELYDKGGEDVQTYYELMLGTIPFDREVIVPDIDIRGIDGNIFTLKGKSFNASLTLYDIFLDLRAQRAANKNLNFDVFTVLSVIISENLNEQGKLDLKQKFIPQIIFGTSNKSGQSDMHDMEDIRPGFDSDGNQIKGLKQGKYTTKDGQVINIRDYVTEIDNNYLVIQLDATHDPNNPIVSLTSQLITNCALEGRTFGLANDMFSKLGQITEMENKRMSKIFNEGNIDLVGNVEEGIEPDFDVFKIRLNNLVGFKELYSTYSSDSEKEILKEKLIEMFDTLPPSLKIRLVLRSIVLNNMDAQNQYNSTYISVDSNEYSELDPQITDKLNSAVGSYISRRTVNMTLPGGNYVLFPSTNIIKIVEIIRNGVKHLVTRDKVTKEDVIEKVRDLQWKGHINEATGLSLFHFSLDEKGNKVYTYPEWAELVKAESKEAKQIARNKIQKLLAKGGWKITPAEFILPYPYKKNFRLKQGMQPIDVTVEYFMEVFGIDEEQAKVKYASFQKSLEVLVNRIPSTGQQSTVIGKMVGFVEDSSNALFIPIELMMVQGADLDIDKGVVLGRNFDSEGNYVTGNNVKGLQNEVIQIAYDIHASPTNQVQGDTPVGFSTLKKIVKLFSKIPKERLRFHKMLPMTVVRAKILTAEGKSMVGVFANGLKVYALTYQAALKAKLAGTKSPVSPLNISFPIFNENNEVVGYTNLSESYKDISNLDSEAGTSQMWEFYSELVNAATDNAKEMILGAIGANLQTGNMINAMTLYGLNAETMFKFLIQPSVQRALKKIRHANDITNDSPKSGKISKVVLQVFTEKYLPEFKVDASSSLPQLTQAYNEALNRLPFEKRAEIEKEYKLLSSLKDMYEYGQEFAILAKLLGINRELPNTQYNKYAYNKSIENHINEALEGKKVKGEAFSLQVFIDSDDNYKKTWIEKYRDNVQKGINLLQVIETTPHIKQYIKAKVDTDKTISSLFTVTNAVDNTLAIIEKNKENKFRTLSEEAFNAIKRKLNEKLIQRFVRDKSVKMHLNGQLVEYKLNSNNDVYSFVATFPRYLFNLVHNGLNPELSRNEFFKSLQPISDAKGTYIGIPNIDALEETRIYELMSELNKDIYSHISVEKGMFISNSEFKNALLLYSLIVSKGKVSKTSFFELFEPKNRRDFTKFLVDNPNLSSEFVPTSDSIKNDLDWINIEKSLAPDGKEFVAKVTDKSKRNLPIKYIKDGYKGELPKFIRLHINKVERIFELTSKDNQPAYALVKNIYPVITITTNDGKQRNHYNATEVFKNLKDPKIINDLNTGKQLTMNLDTVAGKTVQQAVTPIGMLQVNGNKVSKKSKELNPDNKRIGKKADLILAKNILNKLAAKFGVEVEYINEPNSQVKGEFVDGKIVINLANFTLDTPLHEFGHVYLGLIKGSDPELYNKIIQSALEDDSNTSRMVRSNYSELSEEDLGEEIFVTHLGMSANDTEYMGFLGSKSLISSIKSYWNKVSNYLFSIGLLPNKQGLKQNTTLYNLVENIKFELLSDKALGEALSIEDINTIKSFKQSKVLSVTNVTEFINSLIPYDRNTQKDSKSKEKAEFAKMQANILNRIQSDPDILKLTREKARIKFQKEHSEIESYRRLSLEQYSSILAVRESIIESGFKDNKYTKFILLSEINKFTFKDDQGKAIASYNNIGNKYTDHDNVLVALNRDGGGTITFSLFDISFNNLQATHKLPTGATNLFGNYISNTEANKLGIGFTNKQTHVNALKLGILAMDLHKSLGDIHKNANIGIKAVQSLGVSKGILKDGYFIDDVISDLTKALKNEEFNKAYGKFLEPYINQKTNAAHYRVNLIQLYTNFLNYYIDKNIEEGGKNDLTNSTKEKIKLKSLLSSGMTNITDLKEVIKMISERQEYLLKQIKDKSGDYALNKSEIELNRDILLELHGTKGVFNAHQNTMLTGLFDRTKRIGATGNALLDKFYEVLTSAMSKAQNKLHAFSKDFNPLVKELMSNFTDDNGFIKGTLENFTTNDARKFFKNMIETVELTDPETGKKVKVNTGKLVSKTSSEYAKLSAKEKEFVNFFNAQVEKASKDLGEVSGKKFHTDGLIPLMKLNAGYQNIDNAKDILKLPYKKVIETFKQSLDTEFDNGEFFIPEESEKGEVINLFGGQFEFKNKEGKYKPYGNDTRLAELGLRYEGDKLVLLDANKNQLVETDLSIVLHNFVFSQAKVAEFKKVSPLTEAIMSALRFRTVAMGKEDFSLEYAEEYFNKFVNNAGADTGGLRAAAKVVAKASSRSSLVALGFNSLSALANFGAATGNTLKEAMYFTLLQVTGNSAPFNLIDIGKAMALVAIEKVKNPLVADKVDAINRMYKIFNQDTVFLEKDIATQRGLFKTPTAYWFNTVGDKMNREVMIVAQMLHDGSWDAYTFENGELKYDETKDKRFHTNDKFDPNHPLLKRIKEDALTDGDGISNGKLTQGYSRLQRNSMKALSDRVYGSYDSENADKFSAYALFRAFESFKKYMVDKVRIYTGEKLYTTADGEYYPIYKDNDKTKGIVGYAPIGTEQEGVFRTVIRISKELALYRNPVKTWNDMSNTEKKNLMYLLNDALFLSIFLVGFYALFDDEDEKKENPELLRFYKGFLDTASLNMLFGFDSFTEKVTFIPQKNMVVKPFMVTNYFNELINTFSSICFGNFEGEEEEMERNKKALELLKKAPFTISTAFRFGDQAVNAVDQMLEGNEELTNE